LRNALALFPPFDHAFDGFNGAFDRRLHELCRKVRFLAEIGVDSVPNLSLVGLALLVRSAVPTELAGSVRAV
jgi:hypothetical protein